MNLKNVHLYFAIQYQHFFQASSNGNKNKVSPESSSTDVNKETFRENISKITDICGLNLFHLFRKKDIEGNDNRE